MEITVMVRVSTLKKFPTFYLSIFYLFFHSFFFLGNLQQIETIQPGHVITKQEWSTQVIDK